MQHSESDLTRVFSLGSRPARMWYSAYTRDDAYLCPQCVAAVTGIEASNNAVSGYLGAGYAFGKGLYERPAGGCARSAT